MTSEPDILRVTARGSITTPKVGIPVLATIRWRDGGEQDVPATAMAWTAEAVEVVWMLPATGRQIVLSRDWVPTGDVWRGKAAEDRLKQMRAAR